MRTHHQPIQLNHPDGFIGSNADGPLPIEPLEAADNSTLHKPPRILVVEDMKDLADLIYEILTLHGFEVEITPDGFAALHRVEATHFDIALLDIDLPGMSGFELANQACAAGWLRPEAVVFCTGGDIEERRALAQGFPGSRLVAKPFAIKGLVATIAEALDAADPSRL